MTIGEIIQELMTLNINAEVYEIELDDNGLVVIYEDEPMN